MSQLGLQICLNYDCRCLNYDCRYVSIRIADMSQLGLQICLNYDCRYVSIRIADMSK